MNRFKEPPLAGPTAKELWDKNIELQQRIEQLEARLEEYCPDEMTAKQKAEWAKHQVPATKKRITWT